MASDRVQGLRWATWVWVSGSAVFQFLFCSWHCLPLLPSSRRVDHCLAPPAAGRIRRGSKATPIHRLRLRRSSAANHPPAWRKTHRDEESVDVRELDWPCKPGRRCAHAVVPAVARRHRTGAPGGGSSPLSRLLLRRDCLPATPAPAGALMPPWRSGWRRKRVGS